MVSTALVSRPWPPGRIASWAILGVLLLATLAGAVTFDRSGWPGTVGDEATYAMQAASLAFDLDLAYTREDFDRYVEHWGGPPDGLILQSRDGGAHLTYGKPALYALAVAPFVRFAPVRGAGVANALFLALAAGLAASTLERKVGPGAPLWVAAFVFASVAFVYTFWVHADLFLLAAAAAGCALAWGGEPRARRAEEPLPDLYPGDETEAPARRFLLRWLAVGLALGIPAAFRPFYLVLLVPVAFAVPAGRRWSGWAALAAGVLAVALVAGGLQWVSGGSWLAYGGERRGFYARTGYPEVDFPASRWEESVRRWGNASWIHSETLDFQLDPRLWGWNGVYFLAGQNVGVLPYFLPLLLGAVAFASGRGRGWIVPAVLVGAAGFLLAMPFNFFGGTGAVGNRYFLPLYPALWFLAARPARGVWAVGAACLAAPLLWPCWTAPRAFPVAPDGRYHHVSALAREFLPYETTQSHIPGGRDVGHHGLWVKFLSDGAEPLDGGRLLRLTGEGPGRLLVGSASPLPALRLELAPGGPLDLQIRGAQVGSRVLRPDGTAVLLLDPDPPRARHPMWWTRETFHLYELEIRLPEGAPAPLDFALYPAPGGG
jgi:hypothetical protein